MLVSPSKRERRDFVIGPLGLLKSGHLSDVARDFRIDENEQ
jgi:hypothetical protein